MITTVHNMPQWLDTVERKHRSLRGKALAAIRAVYQDTSVSLEQTAESLEVIRDAIEPLIDAAHTGERIND